MFIVDVRSTKPIYEQIVDQVKEQALKGILKGGDQLPSVRQLASMLTINANTVSKAYQELERQKIIETIRGRGTFVCTLQVKKVDEEKMEALYQTLKNICIELHYMGLQEEEIIQQVDKVFKELKGGDQ
ncbi:MAG: GntR family transcriptional regulator [Niameybacter sp.]|uniref:GntR family transcriptional regulator n=1 Tax=Niameybacter sp. TaxID=2033640 RepID=UPI002FC86672